jgi:hypothetical protein
MAEQCGGTKKDGSLCTARAQVGKSVCIFHDPDREADGDRARRAGGLARSAPARVLPADTPALPLNSCKDVVSLLGESISQVRRGELDPRVANAIGYMSGILLKALDQGVIEERLFNVEAALGSLEENRVATTIVERLECAEAAVREKQAERQLNNCICFPKRGDSLFFLYPGIRELALRLKCPLHGDRFEFPALTDPENIPSRIDLEVGWTWRDASEQYRKAWNATFQSGEWPAEEISVNGRTWRLPRDPAGELLDWKNVSSAPPWKRVHAHTLGDDLNDQDREPSEQPKSSVRRSRDFEAERLLEQWGCRES